MSISTVSSVSSDAELEASRAIRRQVFIEEQGVPESLELDALDSSAVHLLARIDEAPVGTARLIVVDSSVVKAGRVAVLGRFRGKGIGAHLMSFAEDWARASGYKSIVLNAQEPVVEFYVRLGYTVVGERFFEAGIAHFKMTKQL